MTGTEGKHTREGGNKAQINLIVIVIKAGSVGGGDKSSKESSEKRTFKIKQEVK